MSDTLYRRIKELIDILKTENIDEIELRHWWTAVRVARRRPRHEVSALPAEDAGAAGTPSGEGGVTETPARDIPAAAGDEALTTAGASADGDGGYDEIVSPMVGTFFRSSAPDSDPFVAVGDRVEVGEVLCIIEAMKLMNEIEADRSGVIRKILVEDNQPVEFGQPLFLVESA